MLTTGLLGSFVTLREKFHSNILVESIPSAKSAGRAAHQPAFGCLQPCAHRSDASASGGCDPSCQQVSREAYILAYNDTFLLIAICAAAALVALLLHLAWLRLNH